MKIIITLFLILVMGSCQVYDKSKPHTFNPSIKYNKDYQIKHRKGKCPSYDRSHQVKHDKNYDKCKPHTKIKYHKSKYKKKK